MARKIEPVIALKKVFLVYPQIPDTRKRPFLTTVQKAKSNEQVNLYSRLSYLIFPALVPYIPGSRTLYSLLPALKPVFPTLKPTF
ncbi:MAG: hypothetical protein M0R80_13455 [Proteobacteria bacterium]|jgi:hypothetical protein|nr:hypothetical protein [Pseudomonadota bacterium]